MDKPSKKRILGFAILFAATFIGLSPLTSRGIKSELTKIEQTTDFEDGDDKSLKHNESLIKEKNKNEGNKLKCTISVPDNISGTIKRKQNFYDIREAINYAKDNNATEVVIELENDIYTSGNIDITGLNVIITGSKEGDKPRIIIDNNISVNETEEDQEMSVFYTNGDDYQLFVMQNVGFYTNGLKYRTFSNNGHGTVDGYYTNVDGDNFSINGGTSGGFSKFENCNFSGDVSLENQNDASINKGNFGNLSIRSNIPDKKTTININEAAAKSIDVDIMPKDDITHSNEPSSYISYCNNGISLVNGNTTDFIRINGCACVYLTDIYLPSGHINIKDSDFAELYDISGKDCSIKLSSIKDARISKSDVNTIKVSKNKNLTDLTKDNQTTSIYLNDSKAKTTKIFDTDLLGIDNYNTLYLDTKNNGHISAFNSNILILNSTDEDKVYINNCGLLNMTLKNARLKVQDTTFPTDTLKDTSLGNPKIRFDDNSEIEFDGCEFRNIDINTTQSEKKKRIVSFKNCSATNPIRLLNAGNQNKEFYISNFNPAYDVYWDGFTTQEIACWER